MDEWVVKSFDPMPLTTYKFCNFEQFLTALNLGFLIVKLKIIKETVGLKMVWRKSCQLNFGYFSLKSWRRPFRWWHFSWPLKGSCVFDGETDVGKISKWRIQCEQSTSCSDWGEAGRQHTPVAPPPLHGIFTIWMTPLGVCKGTASDDQNQPDILYPKMVRGLALTLKTTLALNLIVWSS